jgi:Uma2 family endonuclease
MRPVVVAEVLSEGGEDKDLVCKMALYLQVPSLREYWVLDPLAAADRPALRVHRRRGAAWLRPIDVPFGGVYSTRLLPGLVLRIGPGA